MSQSPRQETQLRVQHGPDGRPVSAIATTRIARPLAKVWATIIEVEKFPGRVPMIHKAQRTGDRVVVDLKFKVSLLSVGFQFTVDAKYEESKWLELAWVAGEPKELRLRFDLEPDGDGCLLHTAAQFDTQSLGFLAKYFLKHHPEIEYGIFPGVAMSLGDSMKRAAEAE